LRFRILALAALAAGVVGLESGGARADNFFSYLKDAPAPVETAAPAPVAAIGTWATSVAPVADASGASPPTPTRPRREATAIAHADVSALRGPAINGKQHALNGLASYYAQGELTANGEHFDKNALTAAHKTLPFGTRVRVTRLDTGSSVVVRINDRGPFKPGRVIDLSEHAAENLGLTSVGLATVRLDVLAK
jgi:rare lipoprotein A